MVKGIGLGIYLLLMRAPPRRSIGRPPPRRNMGYICWRTTIGLGICLLLARPPLGSIGCPPPRHNIGYISWQRTRSLPITYASSIRAIAYTILLDFLEVFRISRLSNSNL
jgi:hypothetical protein